MIAALLLLAGAAAAAPYPAVREDMRVELLGAVRLLAGDEGRPGFYLREGRYREELERRLSAYAVHPVVGKWKELQAAGAGYVGPYRWVLDAPPPGDVSAAEFTLLLDDLGKASGFARHFAQTAALRAPVLESARRQAADGALRVRLESWSGLKAPPYELVVSPFVEPALSATAASGGRLLSVTGPEDFEGKTVLRLSARRGTLWAEALREMLRPYAQVDESVLTQLSFAGAGRLLALAGDEENAGEWPVKHARLGMPHVGAMMKELEGYRAGSGLPSFVPRLLAALQRPPLEPSFSGGLAEALADPAPCVLVLPSEPSPALRESVARFRRERRLCEESLSDAQALARGVKGRVVIAAGRNNRWTRERWGALRLPIRLGEGRVELNARPGEAAGRRLDGAFTLATAAPNPDDPARPALIFTADALVPPPPGADYELRSPGREPVSGVYEKSRLPWRLK